MVGDNECAMVAPWMENGSIVKSLRENLETGTYGTVFDFAPLLTESGRT